MFVKSPAIGVFLVPMSREFAVPKCEETSDASSRRFRVDA